MNSLLFKRVVRLAHENPKLRPKLLPLLKRARWESGEDVPLSKMPKELQDNAENPPPEAEALKEKMKDKAARWESGEDVPLSKMPKKLQDNAKNPPPEAKALKEKMKDKAAGELPEALKENMKNPPPLPGQKKKDEKKDKKAATVFRDFSDLQDYYESSTGVEEPGSLHLDAGMWLDDQGRAVQLHNSATDDSEMLKFPFSVKDLEQAAKRVWPHDNIRSYERFASKKRARRTSPNLHLARKTLRLAAQNEALRPKLLAALKQANRPAKKAGLFPGATGVDAGRPIYPEGHAEFQYAEEAAYQDGLVAAASGMSFGSNPYKYKPYKEAWKDGFRDGK